MMWERSSVDLSLIKIKIKNPRKTTLRFTPIWSLTTQVWLIKEKGMLNCVETLAVSWLLTPVCESVCVEGVRSVGGERGFVVSWISPLRFDESPSARRCSWGSVLNSAAWWIIDWRSDRVPVAAGKPDATLHHPTSHERHPLAVNKQRFKITVTWPDDFFLLVLSLIRSLS